MNSPEAHTEAARVIQRTTKSVRRYAKEVRREPQKAELIHRLRVWSRRTVVALDFFAPLYDERLVRKLRKRFRQLRRLAGDVRDADILLGKLKTDPAPIHKQRRRASKKLRPYTAKSYRRLLKRQVEKLFASAQDQSKPFAEFAHEQLRQVVIDFFTADPGLVTDMKIVHQFRIQAKNLRYSLEFISGLCSDDCSELIASISQMQETLGQLNDTALYQQQLRELGRDSVRSSEISEFQRQSSAVYADMLLKTQAFRNIWTPEFRNQLQTKLEHVLAGLRK